MKSLYWRSFGSMLVGAALACWTATSLAQAPGMPASPLAGGMAAANGQPVIDAYGNQVVMPASYGAPCMGPQGCPCGDPSGGCGNDAYVDFGGVSTPDQCGPHYFDFALQTIFLQPERMFQNVPALGSIGVQGPKILDPNHTFNDFEAGWQIAARVDLGPLSVIEATYFGLYDIGFHDVVRSVDVAPGGADFQLNSVFSNYGVVPIDGLDEGSVYDLKYKADLQSTELSYRRYWVGDNPRISGTYLAGFRYLRLTEDLNFNATALNGNSHLLWADSNDLLGAQFGGDGWVTLRQGLRLGGESKAGIYNNRYQFRHTADLPNSNTALAANGNQVAFAADASLDLVADILPSWSLRGGYQVLYMSSLVTAGNNIDTTTLAPTTVFTQADALFHGFHAGLEYTW